jgi:O-antigen/teichoic acid export membrane protein
LAITVAQQSDDVTSAPATAAAAPHLTSGRLLARNTMWNLCASVASMAIALFSVPILIRNLGADRFGVISLAWVVEGQFSLFDMGLSRALVKLVAEKLGMSRHEEIPPLFWASVLLMFLCGLVGAVVLALVSPALVFKVLKVPAQIRSETLSSFYLVALSLPVVISSAGLRGFLEGHQRFDLLSSVRIPISLFSYLAPLLVLPFSKQLQPVIAILVAARFMAWITHLVLCFKVEPELRHKFSFRGAPIGRLFRFGGWMTVTNIVSPIMVNLDRFFIGALISMTAVTYYATPYEAATKLWIFPSALSGVLFPAFSTALVQNRKRAALLFERGIKCTFLALFPAVLLCLVFAHFALHLWLGALFAQKCTAVLQLLAFGVFVNSLAQVAFWQIQGAGRPDLTARVHLVELPFYLGVFYLLTTHYGIVGAAIAWVLRTSIDGMVVFAFSGRLLSESIADIRRLLWMVLSAVPLFVVAALLRTHLWWIPIFAVGCAGYLALIWYWFLTAEERVLARNPLQFFLSPNKGGLAALVSR